MCDTIVTTPGSTSEGIMLFGKNSDRQRNEAQTVEYFSGADHPPGSELTCTYITIPQAVHTHAVLLCRPFWIWGAEMGANECGVVIGNEGLQARSPAPEQAALTGMDLLRLALERAATAAGAVSVITQLLARHGQGGNCGHLTPAYYNNGFMIADSSEAFVLETIGREWVVERARDVRAMSNAYSIGRDVESVSAGLPALIRNSGWSEEVAPSYADVIADPQSQHIGHSGARRARSTSLMRSQLGQLTFAHMTRILRDHDTSEQTAIGWHPQHELKRTLCLHACADNYPAQTTGSMISELHRDDAVHWVTGTAAPCTSIFKPMLMGVPLPSLGPHPTDRFDPRTLWWRHERLHRAALLGDFAKFLDGVREERDALEADFHSRMVSVLNGGSATERSRVVAQCWKDAFETEDRWFARMNVPALLEDTPYRAAWTRMNRTAGIDESSWKEMNA